MVRKRFTPELSHMDQGAARSQTSDCPPRVGVWERACVESGFLGMERSPLSARMAMRTEYFGGTGGRSMQRRM